MFVILIMQLAVVPNHAVTPGLARPLTVQQICTTKWGTDRRHVTATMKKQVALNYGLKITDIATYGKGPCCEVDHLIPRELGGADDVRNLWPQPWENAKLKDVQENALHKAVCAGTMRLNTAQALMQNWTGK